MDHNTSYNGIVIFGEMSTGKDIFADFLIEIDSRCAKYNIGNAVRQFFSILKVTSKYKGKNRSFGQTIADKLREVDSQFLNDYCLSLYYEKWQKINKWDNSSLEGAEFHQALLSQLTSIKDKELPIIVGGRTYDDFDYWTEKNFLTVGIVCDNETRFKRLVERDGLEVASNSNFKHNTEIDVSDIAKNKCMVVVDNNSTFDHLKLEAIKVLKLL